MTDSQAIQRVSPAEAVEALVVQGDLQRLSADQRVIYYRSVCESLGLNPLTQPFEYLNLNGKLRLYARRDCTDQLRKIHKVSVTIAARERSEDMYVVTARATTPDGRTDESIGAVPIQGLKGENLANALMKGETKAKRRVTLAICGLAMLDESELEGVGMPEPSPRKPGSGTPVVTNVSPHLEPDEEPDAGFDHNAEGDEIYARLMRELDELAENIAQCATYDEVLILRGALGGKGRGEASNLTLEAQRAREGRIISPDQYHQLGRKWQKNDRELEKQKKRLKPDAADSFTDPDEPSPTDDSGRHEHD